MVKKDRLIAAVEKHRGKKITSQLAHDLMVTGWLSESVLDFSKGLRKKILLKLKKKRLSKKDWAIFTKSCNGLFALGMSGASEKKIEKERWTIAGFVRYSYRPKAKRYTKDK